MFIEMPVIEINFSITIEICFVQSLLLLNTAKMNPKTPKIMIPAFSVNK